MKHTTDIAPVRSDGVADENRSSGFSSCCSTASVESGDEIITVEDIGPVDDTGDSVAMATDAMVDAVEAIGIWKVSTTCVMLLVHTMFRLSAELKEQFLAAEDKELFSIQEREIVECECPLPKGVKPIDSRMVYS